MFSEYKYGDRVKLVKTASSQLDNLCGTLVGVSIPGGSSFPTIYIVDMDIFPIEEWPWKCITITEVCLEKIDG
jgi:hypothetical protein